jgi:hypothetical protein
MTAHLEALATPAVPAVPAATVSAADVLRIEKGAPTEEELAAVAVALLALAARTADHDSETPSRGQARWLRVDRSFGHRTPRSWRSEAWRVAQQAGAAA